MYVSTPCINYVSPLTATTQSIQVMWRADPKAEAKPWRRSWTVARRRPTRAVSPTTTGAPWPTARGTKAWSPLNWMAERKYQEGDWRQVWIRTGVYIFFGVLTCWLTFLLPLWSSFVSVITPSCQSQFVQEGKATNGFHCLKTWIPLPP